MQKFNEFQKAADTCDIRDGLFEFIIRELGDDDMDINTAIQRMETVRADVEAVLHALTKGSPPRGVEAPPPQGAALLMMVALGSGSRSDFPAVKRSMCGYGALSCWSSSTSKRTSPEWQFE